MIFWSILVLAIIITVIAVILYNVFECENGLLFTGSVAAVILWIVVIIMAICLIANYTNIAGQMEYFQKRYEVLQYQIDHNMYDNDNEYGKKALYDDICRWNEDLAYRKQAQRDFLIGIFYPNIYDDFNYIELPKTQ